MGFRPGATRPTSSAHSVSPASAFAPPEPTLSLRRPFCSALVVRGGGASRAGSMFAGWILKGGMGLSWHKWRQPVLHPVTRTAPPSRHFPVLTTRQPSLPLSSVLLPRGGATPLIVVPSVVLASLCSRFSGRHARGRGDGTGAGRRGRLHLISTFRREVIRPVHMSVVARGQEEMWGRPRVRRNRVDGGEPADENHPATGLGEPGENYL